MNLEATEIIYQSNDWITAIFVFVFVVLTFIKILFDERLFHSSSLFLYKKYLSIYFSKEKNNVFNVYQILFFTVQALVLSLLFYLVQKFFKLHIGSSNFETFIYILSAVILYFGFRFGIGHFLAYIFNLKKIHNKILYQKISYFNNIILWLLPFLIISVYTPVFSQTFLKVTLIIFSILLIFRYVLLLSNNKKFILSHLFYFILYLCTLEIIPLVIVLKLTI